MVISILPMSVAANIQGQGWHRTGSRWEVSPLTAVRHMHDGTIIATDATWAAISPHTGTGTPNGGGGWVRPRGGTPEVWGLGGRNTVRGAAPVSIVVAADYFQGRSENFTDIHMTMVNGYWLGWQLSRPAIWDVNVQTSGSLGRFANLGAVDYAVESLFVPASASPGALTPNAFLPNVAEDADCLGELADVLPGTSVSQYRAFREIITGSATPARTQTAIENILHTAAVDIWHLEAANTAASRAEATYIASRMDEFVQLVAANRVAAVSIQQVGDNTAWLLSWIVPLNNNQARLMIARSANMTVGPAEPGPVPPARPAISSLSNVYVTLPVEFVTRGGANEAPVHINFQPRMGWGTAGQLTNRTDLTTFADTRFTFSGAAPRYFNRYGRVEVYRSLRIAEATTGAFDATDYHIELEITTPGFYWVNENFTADSSGIHFYTRYGGVGGTTNAASHIGNVTTNNTQVTRTPVSGNNRFTTLSFDVNLPNALTAGRWELDWFEMRGMQIAATDRARPGDVEVEIRVRRPRGWQGAGNWTTNVTWNATLDPVNGNPVPNMPGTIDGIVSGNFNAVNIGNGAVARHNTSGAFRFGPAAGWTTGVIGNGPDDWTWVGNVGLQNVAPLLGNWNLGDIVDSGLVVAARFGDVGLEFSVHEEDDADDHWLRSGMQEWDIADNFSNNWNNNANNWFGGSWGPGGFWTPGNVAINAQPMSRGAIVPGSVSQTYHRTVRTVLRETAPETMITTGYHPIVYSFPEGIQVLGAYIRGNNGFNSDGGYGAGRVWYGYDREIAWHYRTSTQTVNNMWNATIQNNTLSVRPVRVHQTQYRHRLAQLTVQFYVSVMPGFEHLFGDEIEVTVTTGSVTTPFEDSLVVAHAFDPITVETTPIVLDEADIAAWGVVGRAGINDVVITEVEAGLLEVGTRLWIAVEGGLSRSWGSQDHIALGAAAVTVVGCDTMQISAPRQDSHGTFVEIIRSSRTDGAQIVFSGVELSGRVLPGQTYNIMVADNAVAANWDGFIWIRGDNLAPGIGNARGVTHGFFTEEPYPTEAFSFEGTDVYFEAAPPVVAAPATPAITGPVTFGLNSSHTTRDGDFVAAPVFVTVPNITNPSFVTSYVSARVVADLAGLPWGEGFSGFDATTQTATFSDGTTVITFQNGATTATVNGVPTPIMAGGLGADARIIGDRMFVPISFFNTLPLQISVRWNPYVNIADRSITITPAP